MKTDFRKITLYNLGWRREALQVRRQTIHRNHCYSSLCYSNKVERKGLLEVGWRLHGKVMGIAAEWGGERGAPGNISVLLQTPGMLLGPTDPDRSIS